MSSANLQLSPKLVAAFRAAETTPVRWLQAIVPEEVEFDLVAQGNSSGNLEKDLEDVKKAMGKDACMFLICVDEQSRPKKWTITAYVPETAKIRKRMLYASGRQDFKTKLGNESFKGETHVTEPSDLTVEAVLRDKTEVENLPFTEAERALQEEKEALQADSHEKSERGMQTLGFPLTAELSAKLKQFREGEIDWIECFVTDDEKIGAKSTAQIGDIRQKVVSRIDASNPRFYLALRRGTAKGDRTYLVFSCPESSPIRQRMVYSSGKASILEQGGLKFDKLLEIRAPDELDDLFVNEEIIDAMAGVLQHDDVAKPRPGGRRR